MDPGELLRRAKAIGSEFLMPGGGLRLSELRKIAREFSREEVDGALLELQRRGDVVIYPFDDPSLVTKEDREAALRTSGGFRHYLFVVARVA